MRQHVKNKDLLQRKIFDYLKSRADGLEGEASAELKQYRSNMQELSKRNFDVVGLNYLLHKIEKSQITYLGDFHTFDQSPRNFKRILQLLISKNRKIILALELVHAENQKIIQNYLDSHITELEFLEDINYHDSWRFPWTHYKILFDEAKRGNLKIIGLNSKGSLTQRDEFAAQIISNCINKNPDSSIICLFGEYHIAYNKLPALVQTLAQDKITSSIVYQNIDDVYWKLDTKTRDETQVIMFADGEYSIQSSPPWIKYESMIYWFESLAEDPDFDFHGPLLETQANSFNDNVYDNFLYLSQELNSHFNLQLDNSLFENFNLYDYHSIEFVLQQIEDSVDMTDEVYEFYETLVEKGKSFKIINKYDYYCSSYSINRLTYLAGLHIFSVYDGFNFNESILFSNNKTQIFVYLTLRNVFGYFCSKLINPYRKCDLYVDFKNNSKIINEDQDFNKDLTDICDFIVNNKDISQFFESKQIHQLSRYSRSLGYMLGDVLYNKHYENKDKNVLKTLLFNYLADINNINYFSRFFLEVIPVRTLYKLKKSYF